VEGELSRLVFRVGLVRRRVLCLGRDGYITHCSGRDRVVTSTVVDVIAVKSGCSGRDRRLFGRAVDVMRAPPGFPRRARRTARTEHGQDTD
jgi:hypothetical protein